MLVKEFIEEVRIELEDSGKPEGISGTSGLIESIRTALDDHGSSGVIPDAETKLIACLRRNLDDPEDVGKAVSMTDIMNDVSQDVNYAYWNGGSAERWNKPYVTGSLKMGEPRLCDPMTDKQNIKNCQLSPIITGEPMVFV